VIELLPTTLSTAASTPIDWRNAEPGYTALIVVGLLFLAMVFLVRSFLKHARRAREPWEGEDEGD
jgi:hypothetical protein